MVPTFRSSTEPVLQHQPGKQIVVTHLIACILEIPYYSTFEMPIGFMAHITTFCSPVVLHRAMCSVLPNQLQSLVLFLQCSRLINCYTMIRSELLEFQHLGSRLFEYHQYDYRSTNNSYCHNTSESSLRKRRNAYSILTSSPY